jgi:hypothetical protein
VTTQALASPSELRQHGVFWWLLQSGVALRGSR